MAPVLSAELRRRVVAAIGAGASRREATRRFEISPVSAVRCCRAGRADRGASRRYTRPTGDRRP
jgi:transposase